MAFSSVAHAAPGIIGFLGGSLGNGAGQLNSPQGIDVNETGAGAGAGLGDLYVADGSSTGGMRIEQFDASGDFVRAFGWGVVDGSNAFQICTTVCVGAINPSPGGAAGSINGGDAVSVDQATGNVYVADGARTSIFGSDGSFQGAFGWGVIDGSPQLQFCTMATGCQEAISGNGPGQSQDGNSVAVDPTTGNVYVGDRFNRRVQVFDPTLDGSDVVTDVDFVLALGGDVVDGGATGTGTVTAGSATVTAVVTTSKVFRVGQTITGEGIPPGTTIDALGNGTITLSQPAGAPCAPDCAATLTVAAGAGNVPGNEQQEVMVSFGEGTVFGGTFALTLSTPNPSPTSNTTAPIPYNATAAEVEAALVGLPNVGPGNVSVTSANPGGGAPPGGPFTVEFTGPRFADTDVQQLGSNGGGLLRDPGNFMQIFTRTGSGDFEVCDPSVNPADLCKSGIGGNRPGQFVSLDGFFDNPTPHSIDINSDGVLYTSDYGRVQAFVPSPVSPPYTSYTPSVFTPISLVFGNGDNGKVSVDAAGRVFVSSTFAAGASTCSDGSSSPTEVRVLEFDPLGVPGDVFGTCAGIPFSFNDLASGSGIAYGSKRTGSQARVYLFGEAGEPAATLDSIEPNTSGAIVNGTINPGGPTATLPNVTSTSWQAEYKRSIDSTWIPWLNPIKVGAGFEDLEVEAKLGKLEPNTDYEVRLVATKESGLGSVTTAPQSFHTLPVPPSIEAFSSSGLTATSADLNAKINPHGLSTSYHFEYGTTPAFGQQTPEEDIGAAATSQFVQQHIEGLESRVYYFRVVATNAEGTVASFDQTFTFFPPSCPNEVLRQQTGSSYLPDCRAYELVSPGDPGNVLLGNAGVPSPYATAPARFSYSGRLGAIPGFDTVTSNVVDPYVATRTSTGWETSYVGLAGSQVAGQTFITGGHNLDRFLNFRTDVFAGEKNLPYLWDEKGRSLGRWPADVSEIPNADLVEGSFQPSPDFTHLAFSSNNINFDPEGQGLTVAPGSAYDYEAETGKITLISRLPNGDHIPQQPGMVGDPGEFIHFPQLGMTPNSENFGGGEADLNHGVSTDGSHILMSTSSGPPFNQFADEVPPLRLYMHNNDTGLNYDVSRGHAVTYVGMTSDGTRVYFTSDADLTTDGSDSDTSTDLYMWNEADDSVTNLSLGSEGSGNTDGCAASWISKCDVDPIFKPVAETDTIGRQTDNPIASAEGDVYFYSPELLDGPTNGLDGARNLYVYRDGEVRFVADLNADGSAPVTRINISPNGEHAAFVTASRLTSYDNAGFEEMYHYNAGNRKITCVSCLPSGEPPTDDASASFNGLFMADDGRTFFHTDDALVVQDTNNVADVYEYVEGRPQLITSGTAANATRNGGAEAGLMGVSADGVNLYFSTYDTLVAQDVGGPFLKFYVARVGGGFRPPLVRLPCEAADECHGPDSSAPGSPLITSDGDLGSRGNAARERKQRAAKRKAKSKRKRRSKRKRKHARKHQRGSLNAQRGGRK